MTPAGKTGTIEFSRPVSTAGITEKEAHFTIEATPAECAALAQRLGLKALTRLSADLTLVPERNRRLCLEGHLTADVVQVCVVSLADIAAAIDERFTLHFSPDAVPEATPGGEVTVLVDAEDPPEPLIGETIDLGEAVTEHLVLALDPYPRLPGATFAYALPEDPDAEGAASPFAKLAALKPGR